MYGAKCVAINIKSDEPRAVFTHCYGYCIHLAASDRMKTSRFMKMSLKQLMQLPGSSNIPPKPDAKLEQIRKST